MAEGVLRKLLGNERIASEYEIDSVATHDYHVGKPPFTMAVDAAKRRGYDIKHLVARRISPNDFDHFDMILGMDKSNVTSLKTIAPTRCKPKIELLLEYGDKHHGKDVPDPYGGEVKDFELALDMIEDGCKGVVDLLRQTTKVRGLDPGP